MYEGGQLRWQGLKKMCWKIAFENSNCISVSVLLCITFNTKYRALAVVFAVNVRKINTHIFFNIVFTESSVIFNCLTEEKSMVKEFEVSKKFRFVRKHYSIFI